MAYDSECGEKLVYPSGPEADHTDVSASSASGRFFLNRIGRSGLDMKGRPNVMMSASPLAIACSAVFSV